MSIEGVVPSWYNTSTVRDNLQVINGIKEKKMKETGMTDKQFSGFLRMLIDRLEDTKSENGSDAKDKKLDKIISDLRKTIDESWPPVQRVVCSSAISLRVTSQRLKALAFTLF